MVCDHCGSADIDCDAGDVSGKERLVFHCNSCGTHWVNVEQSIGEIIVIGAMKENKLRKDRALYGNSFKTKDSERIDPQDVEEAT